MEVVHILIDPAWSKARNLADENRRSDLDPPERIERNYVPEIFQFIILMLDHVRQFDQTVKSKIISSEAFEVLMEDSLNGKAAFDSRYLGHTIVLMLEGIA